MLMFEFIDYCYFLIFSSLIFLFSVIEDHLGRFPLNGHKSTSFLLVTNKALKMNNWGAGKNLKKYETSLKEINTKNTLMMTSQHWL